eukprot:m.9990 g.9990  ORF g.9990 m.9990 type:complete len:384 (+) comp4176_c0_seq2:16-1167(+)
MNKMAHVARQSWVSRLQFLKACSQYHIRSVSHRRLNISSHHRYGMISAAWHHPRKLSTTCRTSSDSLDNLIVYHPEQTDWDGHSDAMANLVPASPTLERNLAAFLSRVNLSFSDTELAVLAVTHRSWTRFHEKRAEEEEENLVEEYFQPVSNDRLAILGKRNIEHALAEFIYMRYPNLEGELLAQLCEVMSGNEILTRASLNVGYQTLIRSKKTVVKRPGNPDSQRVIAESFAAFVAALSLDQGSAVAFQFSLDMLIPLLDEVGVAEMITIHGSPMKTLHAKLVSEKLPAPEYTILKETGRTTHNPTFLVGVFSGDNKLGEGASYSIKEAKKEAARAALRSHYSTEFGGFELPSRWGDYSVANVQEFISKEYKFEDDVDNKSD